MTTSRGGSLADSAIAARAYDRLVSSRVYNRVAWSTDPAEYEAFAAAAVGSADGPLLEIAAGSTAATLPLYVAARRPVTISDASEAMLELSRARAHRLWPPESLTGIEWQQADMWRLPTDQRYATVLGLGLLHMIEDIPALLTSLRGRCTADGQVWLSGLTVTSRRSEAYLGLLQRMGEVVAPRTLAEIREELPAEAMTYTRGSMVYARVPA